MRNTNGRGIVAGELEIADTAWRRFKGLLGRDGLPDGGGLLITPCNSIHMFFMRFPIDVVWLDGQNAVLKTVDRLKPWRVSFCLSASKVVELPPGRLESVKVAPGDVLEMVE